MTTSHDDDPACFSAGAWDGRRPLDASSLRLRPLVPTDVDAVLALAGVAEVAERTDRIPHPLTRDDAAGWIDTVRRETTERRGAVFAIERLTEPGLIGVIGLALTDDGTSATVGFWLGCPFWGQGRATEAVKRLAAFAFASFPAPAGLARLDRLVAHVLPDNPASHRVLDKAGFTVTGTRTGIGTGRCRTRVVDERVLTREVWAERWAARPLMLVTAAALIDADGRVLLAQRPPGKPLAGLWEFPGGKVHAGETPEAALVRELAEELGITVRETCLAPLSFASHAYVDAHLLMPLFACRTWRGRMEAREGQGLAWVTPARLRDYAMPPADVPLVAALQDLLMG